MSGWNLRDLVGALLFASLGVIVLVGASGYRLGTAQSMGPGYFPTVLGVVLIALSLIVGLLGMKVPTRLPSIAWRPLIAVAASIVAFGLALRWLGLIPAIFLTVSIAALGDSNSRLLSVILTAIVLAVASWAIFRLGLGLPMPAFREF